MQYQELRPSAPLRRYVECLWFLSDDAASAQGGVERIVPDGCMELIVHLGDPFERLTADGFERQAPALLGG